MAWVEYGMQAYISLVDSRNKISVHAVNVATADAKAYVAAADEAARNATDIGIYFNEVIDLSEAEPVDRGVRYNTKNDALIVPAVDAEIYNFDKISIGWSSGLRNFVTTIPARDMAAVTVVARNGDIDMTGGAAQDWIQAFLDVAVDPDGNPATAVNYMRISQ